MMVWMMIQQRLRWTLCLSYAIVVHSLLKKTKVGRQEGLNFKEGLALLFLFLVHMIYYLFFNG